MRNNLTVGFLWLQFVRNFVKALHLMDLRALNKASPNIGVFELRILRPRLEEREFMKNNQTLQAQRFKCLMIDPQDFCFCLGTVRGTNESTDMARHKRKEFSTSTLRRVTFDLMFKSGSNSCPLKVVINLAGSSLEASQEDSLPRMIQPPFFLGPS